MIVPKWHCPKKSLKSQKVNAQVEGPYAVAHAYSEDEITRTLTREIDTNYIYSALVLIYENTSVLSAGHF